MAQSMATFDREEWLPCAYGDDGRECVCWYNIRTDRMTFAPEGDTQRLSRGSTQAAFRPIKALSRAEKIAEEDAWVENLDAKDNKGKVWENKITEKSTSAMPPALQNRDDVANTKLPTPPAPQPSPPSPVPRKEKEKDQWFQIVDESTKKKYWYNKKTGVRQWDRPYCMFKYH